MSNRPTLAACPDEPEREPSPLGHLEPWLDLHGIADHFAVSERWIRMRMDEGLPSTIIGGRTKFRASQVERWLDDNGHIERRGDWAA